MEEFNVWDRSGWVSVGEFSLWVRIVWGSLVCMGGGDG